jgi:hypothetical protein
LSITASHCEANAALQNLLEPSRAWRALLGSPGSSLGVLGAASCLLEPSGALQLGLNSNTHDDKGSECHFLPRGVPCAGSRARLLKKDPILIRPSGPPWRSDPCGNLQHVVALTAPAPRCVFALAGVYLRRGWVGFQHAIKSPFEFQFVLPRI